MTYQIRKGRRVKEFLLTELTLYTIYKEDVFKIHYYTEFYNIFQRVCEKSESTLTDFLLFDNYLILQINFSVKVTLSKLVNSLKGVSSRLIKKEHPEIEKYYHQGALWNTSYTIRSRSTSIEKVNSYYKSKP